MNFEVGLKEYMINNLNNDLSVNKFSIVHKSLFDVPAQALVNSINCVSVMGAGIALEFKKRYPDMFNDYKIKCSAGKIKPGDCYLYIDKKTGLYILGLAVKKDWRYWSSVEYIEMCLKSLKLVLLENDIKSVNMPLIGSSNGRKGPLGKILGMTPPPSDKEELKALVQKDLENFSNKFNVDIRLCIPEGAPKKIEPDLTLFF